MGRMDKKMEQRDSLAVFLQQFTVSATLVTGSSSLAVAYSNSINR